MSHVLADIWIHAAAGAVVRFKAEAATIQAVVPNWINAVRLSRIIHSAEWLGTRGVALERSS